MKVLGWVKLHRKIQLNHLYECKPFDKCRAFVDLILNASFEDEYVDINKETVLSKTGDYVTSLKHLCTRWGWSKGTAKRFLDELEMKHMIVTKRNSKYTVITIVNYSIYQGGLDSEWNGHDTEVWNGHDTQHDTQSGTHFETDMIPKVERKRTPLISNTNNSSISKERSKELKEKKNKEDKNNYNNAYACEETVCETAPKPKPKTKEEIRHEYGEYKHVRLTDEQYSRLLNDFGQYQLDEMIKILDEAIQMKGYKYKDFNLVLRGWVLKEYKRKNVEKPERTTYTQQMLYDSYQMMADWANEKETKRNDRK